MRNDFFRVRFLAACALALTLAAEASAQVPAFDALYVFGDSLADNGNDYIASSVLGGDPAVPPSESPNRTYFKGRFSNGYVSFEYLWQRLSGNAPGSLRGLRPFLAAPFLPLAPATNFAFGGTGTPVIDQAPGGQALPGLKGQVALYRAAIRPLRAPKRPLFAIVTGPNDYRLDAYNTPMNVEQVVGNIVDAVATLYTAGARDVMVLNMPDLGLVPAYAADGALQTQLSLAHNAALRSALTRLGRQLPKLRIIQPDLMQVFDALPAYLNRAVPALAAIYAGDPTVPPGMMAACLFIDPATCRDVPLAFNSDLGFVFWDIMHPTTEAHRFLADQLYDALRDAY